MSARIDQKLKHNGVSAAEYLADYGDRCSPEERDYLRALSAPAATAAVVAEAVADDGWDELLNGEKTPPTAVAVAEPGMIAVAEPDVVTVKTVAALVENDDKFHQYLDYITPLGRPGDTLCFVAIQHNRDGVRADENVVNEFVSYEESLTRGAFNELTKANNTASKNPRNTMSSIYVAMNAYPKELIGSRVGRTQQNVVAVRALQADIDYNGATTMDAIKSSGLLPTPSVVVESSTGKFQGIWFVDGISNDEAKPLMQAIAATFRTDSAVAEIARVMRVPGFVNRKYDTAPVARIASQTNARYARADFCVTIPVGKQFEEKSENWVNDVVVTHGNAYNDLLSLAGYYVRSKNINDPEMLYKLLAGHCETAVEHDGKTLWQPDLKQVRAYAEKWVKEFETGESIAARTNLVLNMQPDQTAQEPQTWGEIIPLEDILLPVPPFEENFLPVSIRPYCLDVAHRMSVPLDFTGIAAIETLFGVTGRRVFVYPKANDKTWKESLAASGGIVAGSGRTKTPVWKMYTNVIVEQEMDWTRAHAGEHAKFEELHKKWEEAVKSAGKDKSKLDTIGTEPEPPVKSMRLVLNDATPEKIHSLMSENPTGLFYYRDELSGWVDELDKEGREGQRTLFLSAMTGNDPHAMDRISRGTVFAIMCLTVAGNFQPDLLRRFLSDNRNVADGMVARFSLLVWPDSVKPKALDIAPNEQAKNNFRHVIRTLAAIKTEAIRMHFDQHAQVLYLRWLTDLIDRSEAESHEGKKAHYDKYKGALPKVAALFQLVDMVALGGTFQGDHQIDLAHLQMAIDFFRYLEAHMHRIYDSACGLIELAEFTLMGRIQNGEMADMMTAREIQRKKWTGMRQLGPLDVESALQTLTERNWVRPVEVKPNGPGRPTIRWEINPAGKKPRRGR